MANSTKYHGRQWTALRDLQGMVQPPGSPERLRQMENNLHRVLRLDVHPCELGTWPDLTTDC